MFVGLVYLIIVLHMGLYWLWYRLAKNPGVVDVGWGTGLTVAGLMLLFRNGFELRSIILGGLLLLWGLRLAGYLWFTRIRVRHVDPRYLSLSDSWKMAKSLGFFLNFQLQGLLIMLVVMPWYFIGLSNNEHIYWFDWPFIFIALLGLMGETLADWQLQQFKKNPSGLVCDGGLWRLSRHPNYFFEWLIWMSFAALALSHPMGFLAFISPLALYIIMTKITGPMTEAQSIKSRGEAYLAYQKKTPMFFLRLF